MIVDRIENISNYKFIPEDVILFLKNLTPDISLGRYELKNGNYVNVETYNTKSVSDSKFEAHNDYIDIQLLVSGIERIYYKYIDGLSVAVPYDKTRDIVFYSNSVDGADYVTLNGENFMLIFPHEAHAPQVCVNNILEVKKVVAKVKI